MKPFPFQDLAEIGIIGGSGFYDLAASLKEIKVDTPFGAPSEKIAVGEVAGRRVAFLPRHSKTHDLPPHQINFRANLWALHSLGVREIITSHACGSLQAKIKPGNVVILDQFIDRTCGRRDSFFDGPYATHVSTAYPYCERLRKAAIKTAKKMGLTVHPRGTVVVIQGPRFSTAAESEWYTKMGWEVVNMTQYPEVVLARELQICYCAITFPTDFDAGVVSLKKLPPVSAREVVEVFKKNVEHAKSLMKEMLKNWPSERNCVCGQALEGARF